jgi:hypothetical protein
MGSSGFVSLFFLLPSILLALLLLGGALFELLGRGLQWSIKGAIAAMLNARRAVTRRMSVPPPRRTRARQPTPALWP